MSLGLAMALPAQAQTRDLSLEEIVVTARKKEESLQSIPLAVTAFTSEALLERNIRDQNDLSMQTLGLSYTSPGGLSTARPIIRGMSQSSRAGNETNVATFIDGVYIDGFSSSAVFMDSMERVEVVRGPQSALYGRNSFAGAINYITKKPTNTFEAGGKATIGQNSRYGVTGYVNGPLVEDKLLARVDAVYDDTGGYYKDAASGQHLGASKTYGVRGGLTALFSDVTTATLQVSYQDIHTNTFARNVVDPNDPRIVGRVLSGPAGPTGVGTLFLGEAKTSPDARFEYNPRAFAGDEQVFHSNLTVTAAWDSMALTSITGYDKRTFDTLADQDRTPQGTTFTMAPRPPFATPRFVEMKTLSGTREKREAFSQELRLESKGWNRINWAVGGYYSILDLNEVRRQGGEIISNRTVGPNPAPNTIPVIGPDGVIPLAEITDSRTTFTSLFASVDVDLLQDLVFSAEGRYTWEKKHVDNSFLSASAGNVGSGLEKADFKYFTPRFILNYVPTEDLTLYASVAKGTKSGGINAGVRVIAAQDPSVNAADATYQPEKAWSYEVGTKFSLLDRRVRGSVAAYYVDWTNQQISNSVRVVSVNRTLATITNASKSTVKGVEVEGTALLAEGLVANAGYSFNLPKYDNAVLSSLNVENSALYGFPGGDVSGHTAPNTSKHSFNAGVEFAVPAFSDYTLVTRADYIYRSKQYDTAANIGWVGAYNGVNLNAGFENDNSRIGLFCNNVLNDRGASVAFNSRNINGEVVYQIQPREGRRCGLTLSLKMN